MNLAQVHRKIVANVASGVMLATNRHNGEFGEFQQLLSFRRVEYEAIRAAVEVKTSRDNAFHNYRQNSKTGDPDYMHEWRVAVTSSRPGFHQQILPTEQGGRDRAPANGNRKPELLDQELHVRAHSQARLYVTPV